MGTLPTMADLEEVKKYQKLAASLMEKSSVLDSY